MMCSSVSSNCESSRWQSSPRSLLNSQIPIFIHTKCETQHEKFLIPELLPKETPELPEWNNQDALGFEYHYNILPEGLLPRFIVRTHALSEGCARWRN